MSIQFHTPFYITYSGDNYTQHILKGIPNCRTTYAESMLHIPPPLFFNPPPPIPPPAPFACVTVWWYLLYFYLDLALIYNKISAVIWIDIAFLSLCEMSKHFIWYSILCVEQGLAKLCVISLQRSFVWKQECLIAQKISNHSLTRSRIQNDTVNTLCDRFVYHSRVGLYHDSSANF